MLHLVASVTIFLIVVAQVALADLVSHNPNDIHYYLHPDPSNQNFSQELIYLNYVPSSFKRNTYTVFILHGFNNVGDPDLTIPLKNSYLNSGINGNFIRMDWYALTTVPPNPVDIVVGYGEVVTNVPIAAERLANVVAWLIQSGYVQLDNIHFIGHSLGAHASGEAALRLQTMFPGQKVPRVTGMDPAGPLFFPQNPIRNIEALDAHFVDIYHSNRGMLGELTFEGHADFILNEGTFQPNCSDFSTFPPGKCSHAYSTFFYAYSINHAYTACLDLPGTSCLNPVRAGEYVPPTTRGKYCVIAPALNFDCAATSCPGAP